MYNVLSNYFGSGSAAPPGDGLRWTAELLSLQLFASFLIGVAFWVVAAALWYVTRCKSDLPFKWMFALFGAFALASGAMHLVEVWSIWRPAYWLNASLNALVAALSAAMAIALWSMMPRILALRLGSAQAVRPGDRPAPADDGTRAEISGAQQRDQRALREREEYFRYLFEANPMPMWVRDEETDRFVAVNEAVVRLYGYTHEQFLEMTGLDLRPPEDRAAYLEFSRRGEARLKTLRRWRHRKKDGALIEVEVTLHGFTYKGRPARLALIADITERVRAERALQESEQRYRDLFDLNPSPMWVFDNDTLAFVAVNEAATRQYGYTKDEFARMSLVDLYPREEVPELLETLRGRDPRNVVTRSVRQCRKDGSILDVQILASPLPNPQRTLRIVHAVDVSHRNRAEAALRESEERLRTIADNVPVLIGYIDAGERFQFANKTHEKWYGVPVEEYRGRHVREILGDDVYREHKPGFDTALSGRIVSEERRTRSQIREQYAYFTYLPHRGADGTVLGFYVLGYDVTERRKATEALAAERSLLRAVIDALPDRVYVKDRDRRYILVNAASLQSRGLSSHDEVVGRTAYDFFAREQAAAFEAEDEEVMRSDKPLLNREQSTVMPGDDVQWHLTNKVPLRAGGAVIGVIGVNRDVTGIRKATEAIRQLNAELEERVRERTAELEVANKELESFTYAVSHDLRAPLRSIDGFSRALLEDYRDRFDETGKDYLRRVRNATQRMGNLIDDLLTLSRITRSEIRQESVHLSAVAREIAAELQKDDPEREVEFDIHAGIRAKADPNLLRVALQNLLHNAWKFTGRAASAKIDVGTMRQRGRPVYYVRDNGAGFDMAYADRLFGAFQRLHSESEFPGTGVGLATVQRIVRRHGGEVWAEGAVDRGATFYFTLGQGRAAKGRDESSAETGAA